MRYFKRSTAWALVLCLIMSLALTVVPAAAEDNSEVVDPYVYYWRPDAEMVPDYYARYARPYMLYSGHNVHHKGMDEGGLFQVRFFNLVNTDALIADEAEAPSGGYATTGVFCADAETYIVAGTAYRRMNLEDGYFNSDSSTLLGTVDARKIRAVLRNSITNLDNLPALEQKINAYLTATYGDEAVLVSGLTGSQLLSATQASVWHYANGFDFSAPYPYQSSDDFANWSELTIDATAAQISYPDYPSSFMDVANDYTATNICGVYEYLLSLPGESPREIMITDESISLADAVISGNQSTVTLLVDVNGTINEDDVLTLTAKCGAQIKSFSLGSVNTLDAVSGLYPVTLTGVSAEDCESVELVISGTQAVDDVCYFEAKPTEETDGRKTSQNLTGFGHDTAPVYSEASMDVLAQSSLLEITKVDEQSGKPLSGVAFDLYRKTEGGDLKIGSYVTDAEGKISVHVTDADEFYFVETGALEGYEAITGQITAGEVPNSWNAGSLEVSKKLINTTPAQVGETFNFKLTLDLSTAPVMGNEISWMTEQYLMDQLECSKELSWTVSGEKELTATFPLDADEKITVDSIPLGTTYTLEEVMTEEDRLWFHVTTQVDNEAVQKGNIASGSIASENAVLFTNSVATSEVQYGKLAVSKKLINTTPAQVGETFNFKITLDFSTANVYADAAPWINDEYLLEQVSCAENLTWTETDGKYTATFTVDADETVTVDGLACGTTYTLEEVLTEEERQWFTVTAQVNDSEPRDGDTAGGIIAQENAVLFTNAVVTADVALSKLAVSKNLINTTPAQVGETFNFKITLDFSTADVYTQNVPWMNDEYLMSFITGSERLAWTEIDGKYTATFTVDAAETVTVDGLALGTTYTLEEIMTEEERQWFTVTSKVCNEPMENSPVAQGSIGTVNAVLFTNSVVTEEVKLGELAVSKKLVNTTPAQVGETFNFKITLDFSTADIYTKNIPWMNDGYLMDFVTSSEALSWTQEDGKYTADFTVDADETVTFSGIAYGTAYTVQEVLTDEDRLWFESNAQIGDEALEGNVAQSTVAEKNAVAFTNSVVTGPVLVTGSVEVSKKLVNTTPAQVGETFNFQITLDLSTADVYTDAAPWMNDEYLMSFISGSRELTWTEDNGKFTAAFTVNADETFFINGIAQGATYTLQEVLTDEDRQWFTTTCQIGNEDAKASNTVTSTVAENNGVLFTNSVITGPELKLGDVAVSKKLVNTTPAQVGETFNFQITLDLSTADVYTDAAPWMNDEYLMSFISGSRELTWTEDNGKFTAAFTVNADETFFINGIAQGATYTLQEVLTDEDRQWFTTTCQIGNEDAEASDTLTSTVAESNAVTFTNSVVTGIALSTGRIGVGKDLTNAPSALTNQKYSFRITLDLSDADIYQNPAPWMYDDFLMSRIVSNQELIWTKSGDKLYTATFTLQAGETINLDGVALGTGFIIEEVLAPAERQSYRVTTSVSANGGAAVQNESTSVNGNVSDTTDIVFINKYVAPIPVTDDLSLTAPMVLCLLALMMTAVLTLNKRRFIG